MEYQLLAPLFFVIISLLTGAIMKFTLRKCSFPYTVGLFTFGILLGTLCRTGVLNETGILKASIDSVGSISPDLILYIFLPILIFDAAYELNIHIFRKTLVNSTILAVPGVILTMLLTACCVMGLTMVFDGFGSWNWTYAMMFGALISATDPVAVVALLKELGSSKRFSTLVDTESLLNDGTGIVLFMLFFATYSTHTAFFESLPLQFLSVVTGGLIVGYLIAILSIWFIKRVNGDTLVQTSAVLLATYVTYFVAEGCFHVSGVIALVAFGLTLSYSGKHQLKPRVNKFMEEFWGLSAYIANTLIFILVGVVIAMRVDITLTGILALVIIYVAVNLIRLAVVFLFYPIMKRCGYGLSIRECIILGWGGLRGAVGLTLALMVSATLPIPEDVRKQILFLTAGIVTLTLTFNATTIRKMLQMLGLADKPLAKELLDYNINMRVAEESRHYVDRLKKRGMLSGADWETVESYLPETAVKPEARISAMELACDMRIRILNKERQMVQDLFTDGTISLVSMRKLIESIDDLYDHDGAVELSKRDNLYKVFNGPIYVRLFSNYPMIIDYIDHHFNSWVIEAYDLGRGFLIIQNEALKTIKEFGDAESMSEEQAADVKMLSSEVEQNIEQIGNLLENLSVKFPISYKKALTYKAVRMLLCEQRRNINRFVDKGLLAENDAEQMLENIDLHRETIRPSRWNRLKKLIAKLK